MKKRALTIPIIFIILSLGVIGVSPFYNEVYNSFVNKFGNENVTVNIDQSSFNVTYYGTQVDLNESINVSNNQTISNPYNFTGTFTYLVTVDGYDFNSKKIKEVRD